MFGWGLLDVHRLLLDLDGGIAIPGWTLGTVLGKVNWTSGSHTGGQTNSRNGKADGVMNPLLNGCSGRERGHVIGRGRGWMFWEGISCLYWERGDGTLLRRGFVGGMTQPGAADTGAYLYCLPELDDRLALDASDSR